MFLREKYIATLLIVTTVFLACISPMSALETAEVNSLDALPYATIADMEARKTLLDTESTPAPHANIAFEHAVPADESLITLLAAKQEYLSLTPSLTPSLSPVFSGIFVPFSQTLSGFLPTDPLLASSGTLTPDPFAFLDTVELPLEQKVGKNITLDKKSRERKTVPTARGTVQVEMETGTTITTPDGAIIDTSLISIAALDGTKKAKAKAKYEKTMKNKGTKKKGMVGAEVEGFEFGLSGSHLIFSRPVKLSIDTPMMSDGMVVDLMTMHAGDADFHTGGLSISPDTLCNSDGTASLPGAQAIVKNGKVTFYTCGASSFTMNPAGGIAGSNDLRIIVGDCAQAQIYYNGQTQIYTGNPAATGCGLPAVWAALRIGGTTYGNGVDGVTATAWSTRSTTGSTNGNTYTATSTMTRVVRGLTYTLIIDYVYTAPNKYFTWSYRVIVPATNTANVRFYFANDSFVAGADTNDTGYFTNTGGQTIGVYDSVANVLSAFRYLSGALWTAYEAGPYATVGGRITGGTDFANTFSGAGDLAYGVNWNFGTGANITYSGTVEWRLLPYVSASVPDLIPGIGAPEGPLTSNLTSQYPINITNAGNLSSSGVHTVVLTIPTNIVGPASSFTDNGWSCGAQVGTGVTCTKTTTIAPITGSETVRIPVTPNTAASGSNVTFNVFISNPGDSNVTNNTALSTNPVVGGVAISPGGVAGATLWLRAGNGTNCTTTGCTITTWANSGTLGAAANAITGLGTVTYDPTNRINGNPTIYFNSASLNTNSSLNITTAAASVFNVTSIGAGGAWNIGTLSGTANGVSTRTSPTSNSFGLFGGVTFYSGANSRVASRPAITTMTRSSTGVALSRTDGFTTLSSGSVATAFATSNIGIGRTSATNSTLSNVGEVIVYPTELTGSLRNRVESYLAIKYGITLDQTTATDYIYSNGTVIWNATSAGTYKNNIAGIGRDDTSTLSQLRSQSVTNTGDIIVAKSSIGTNRMGLLWANDGASVAAFTGTDSPTGYQRLPREWLFQEKNGDLATVTISYPAGTLPAMSGSLYLLTDTDSTFASGATAYTGTYSTGSNTWDFSLGLADMQYVAFAKSVPTDTTPPVILSNSVASGTLAPYGTFPITLTYADTGSSIVAGSLTGRIYAWDATGATWSSTNIASPYLTITSASTSTGVFQLTGLPYGKYRFDFIISDSVGNTLTQSYTYYVDAIVWTISAPSYDIGPAQTSITTFGTGELLLTVQTVGAAFDLSMLRTNDLTYITDVIPVYSGSTGWGYDKNIGSGYSSTITPHGTTQTIVSVAKNINTNGARNTFTYRVKYGVNASANAPAGDYSGNVRFGINLTY